MALPALTFLLFFTCTSSSGLNVNVFNYDKGPNSRQEKQYVSRPYSSLEGECQKARVIVEHCSIGDDGLEQYTTCDMSNFWNPTLEVVKCVYPKMKCKEYYSTQRKTYAKCVDDTRKPSFPKTGSISWKGTVKWDAVNFEWERKKYGSREQTAYVHGRAWKDDKRNFYRIESKVERFPGKGEDWDSEYDMPPANIQPPVLKTAFEIIKTDGNGFTRYQGQDVEESPWSASSQKCSKTTGKEQSLTATLWTGIWNEHSWQFRLKSRKRLGNGIHQEIWREFFEHEEWDETITWKMNFNETSGYAVPVSMEHILNTSMEGRSREKYTYSYQPLGEDLSFEIPKYCP